jgi:hypothetical protein
VKPAQPDAKPDKQAERDIAADVWFLAQLAAQKAGGK